MDSRGIFGVLGVERVQLIWSSWAVLGLLVLASRFSRNAWLCLQELRLRARERLEHEAERVYIVTRGHGTLLRTGPGGHDILLGVLSPGQIIRDDGILQAETSLELLALPASAL